VNGHLLSNNSESFKLSQTKKNQIRENNMLFIHNDVVDEILTMEDAIGCLERAFG